MPCDRYVQCLVNPAANVYVFFIQKQIGPHYITAAEFNHSALTNVQNTVPHVGPKSMINCTIRNT